MPADFWIEDAVMQLPTAIIKVGGRIGVNPAKELRVFCEILRDQGFQNLILDMSQVTFIASSGLGALIVLTGEFSIGGGSVSFVSPSDAVRRAIELLNLSQFLRVCDNLDEALESSKSRTS